MTKPDEIAPFFNCHCHCLSYVMHAKNTLVGPMGPFKSTLILTDFTPNRFLAYFEVGLEPSCN